MDVAVVVRQIADPVAPGRLAMDERDDVCIEAARRVVGHAGAGTVIALALAPGVGMGAMRRALALGADRAVLVADEALAGSNAVMAAGVLAAVVRRIDADLVMAGADWNDAPSAPMAAPLAEALGLPLVSFARSVRLDGQVLVIERPGQGGYDEFECPRSAVVTLTADGARPPLPTFAAVVASRARPVEVLRLADVGIFPDDVARGEDLLPRSPVRAGVVDHDDDARAHLRILDMVRLPVPPIDRRSADAGVRRRPRGSAPSSAVGLRDAAIVVAGGRGLQGTDGFARLEELANLLGGAVAGTGPAVDDGWVAPDGLVGQSGTTVEPQVYIAFGISGTGQHLAGMAGALTVVAVNTDPAAPIMAVADLAVVGDAAGILARLVAALNAGEHP